MSNDVKRKQKLVIAFIGGGRGVANPVDHAPAAGPRSREAVTAWTALMALLLGLLGLLTLLPPPTAVLGLTGTGTRGLDAAVMAGVSVLVWGLTTWVVAVAVIAAVGVLPGACGRSARGLLRFIAPRVALRLVAVAVGASALAGTTACAAPIFAEPLPAESAATMTSGVPPTPTPSSATGIATTSDASAPPAPAAAVTSPVEATLPDVRIPLDWPAPDPTADAVVLDIDWPADAAVPPTPGTTSPGATSSGPTAPNPTAPGPTAPGPTAPGSAASPVIVQPGDTLWSLAQRSLPASTDDAAVDTAWRQWYALNRDVIGADPDRLEPGQVLTAPSTDERNSR